MELEKIKILIADDEEDIREFLEYVLKKEGAIVFTAQNGQESVEIAEKNMPDIIVLDKLMPVLDGISACRQLRSNSKFLHSKILILSAIGDDESQIEGLEIGADDYLVKPMKSNLLISKIKSHLRNIELPTAHRDVLEYKFIKADKTKYLAYVHDKEVILPKKEFELFCLLLSRPDYVYRRDEILETIWGKNIIVGDRTIDVHIRKIREKIGEDYFKTIKGIGYKFVAF